MRYRQVVATLAILSVLAGCSTRPRNFAPQIAQPITDSLQFESDYRTCAALVAQGRTSDFKAAAATAGAAGAGALGGAAVSIASLSAIGFTGAGIAATAAIPGLGLLAGFGVSRMIRTGNERRFKRRMETCLGEYAYAVGDWTKIERREDAATAALAAARPIEVAAGDALGTDDAATAESPTAPIR